MSAGAITGENSRGGMRITIPVMAGSDSNARLKRLCEWCYVNLPDGYCLTLEEIATAIGVTRERIRQIEDRALRKLRHPSRKTQLED